jgi:hypothetical protein
MAPTTVVFLILEDPHEARKLLRPAARPVHWRRGAGSCPAGESRDVHVYAGELRSERVKYEETVTLDAVEAGRLKTTHARTDRPAPAQGLYGGDWSVMKSGFSGSQYEPAAPTLPQPLQVGSKWEGNYEVTNPAGAKSRMKMELTVAAQEKVQTPAGEFEAFRIEGKSYLSGVSWRGGFGVQQKTWYAPAIGRIVKGEYSEQRTMGNEIVYELKQFRPAD